MTPPHSGDKHSPGFHFTGACGAGLGVGIAFGLILGSNPLKPYERKTLHVITREALRPMAELEAARCSQREAWLALRKAARLSGRYLDITLEAETPLPCLQAELNAECIETRCPLDRMKKA